MSSRPVKHPPVCSCRQRRLQTTLRRSRTVPAEGAAPSQIRPNGSPVDSEAAAERRTVAQNVPLRRPQTPRTDHGRTPVIRGIFSCSEVHRFLNRGEGGLVWSPPSHRYPCFCCPVIVPFRSHEWDRLVSGWASNYHPDIGAGSIQGIRLVTAKVRDPSGSHFEVTTPQVRLRRPSQPSRARAFVSSHRPPLRQSLYHALYLERAKEGERRSTRRARPPTPPAGRHAACRSSVEW